MNMLNSLQSKLVRAILLGIAAVLMVFWVYSLRNSAINPDAAYYISVTRLIDSGLVPFKDFQIHYPPGGFYLVSTVHALLGIDVDFRSAMYIVFFFHVTNSILLFQLIRRYTSDTTLSLGSVIVYFIQLYTSEGVIFVLEPFAVFWGLLGLHFVFLNSTWSITIAGCCASAAIITKQYGLAFLPIYILQILLLSESSMRIRLKDILVISLSFIATTICIFSLFLQISGEVTALDNLMGGGYGDRSLATYLQGAFDYLSRYASFLLVLPLAWKFFNQTQKRTFLVVFSGVLLFSFQFFFATFPHYGMLLLPFSLTAGILIAKAANRFKTLFYLSLLPMIVWTAPNIIFTYKRYCSSHTRQAQLKIASQVNTIVPAGSLGIVTSNNLLFLYLDSAIAPADLRNNRFGFENLSELRERIPEHDFLITRRADMHKLVSDEQLADHLEMRTVLSEFSDVVVVGR